MSIECIIQMAYPQSDLACHARHQRHQRRQSSQHGISQRDPAILAHLDRVRGITPARLATHLNISASTLSEALKRLAQLGYIKRTARAAANGKRGGSSVLLSETGASAIAETSVLEASRLHAVLETLSAADRMIIEEGINALAAVRRMWSENAKLAARSSGPQATAAPFSTRSSAMIPTTHG